MQIQSLDPSNQRDFYFSDGIGNKRYNFGFYDQSHNS